MANGKGTAKRRNAKPSVGAKRLEGKTLRMQLHLGEQTVERLRVHTALSHESDSVAVDRILLSWLAQYGKGRELFGPLKATEAGSNSAPDTGEDRQEGPSA